MRLGGKGVSLTEVHRGESGGQCLQGSNINNL